MFPPPKTGAAKPAGLPNVDDWPKPVFDVEAAPNGVPENHNHFESLLTNLFQMHLKIVIKMVITELCSKTDL